MSGIEINYLAVLVSAVVMMALGFLWYGPLFGKMWMKESGITPEKMEEGKKKGMGKIFSINFLATLVIVLALAIFIERIGVNNWLGGVKIAVLAWLGFVATVSLNDVLFGGKTVKFYLINIGYQLASFLIAGVVLSLWM